MSRHTLDLSAAGIDSLGEWLEIAPGLLDCHVRAYGEEEDGSVTPTPDRTFRALELLRPGDVRVVILGQDPYPTPGKASGLSFGYHPTYSGRIDSSLGNILTEIGASTSAGSPRSLEGWARQGVLLLNSHLTVRVGSPLSHHHIGWEREVVSILRYFSPPAPAYPRRIVWIGWGGVAQRLLEGAVVHRGSPGYIYSSHPCKFSATSGRNPFLGSKWSERANDYLESIDLPPIRWLEID